jgi:hypothetical protein
MLGNVCIGRHSSRNMVAMATAMVMRICLVSISRHLIGVAIAMLERGG